MTHVQAFQATIVILLTLQIDIMTHMPEDPLQPLTSAADVACQPEASDYQGLICLYH